MHDSIRRLQDSGILDDFEVRILHDQVNNLIKQLWLLPIEMQVPDPESLFRNIHWVGDDKKLAAWLMDNANICHFDLNEMIIQDDEEPDSIYLITKGLVKIVYGNYRKSLNLLYICLFDLKLKLPFFQLLKDIRK